MPKKYNAVNSLRVRFPKGKQSAFLKRVRIKSGFGWNKIAHQIGLHPRTLRDWAREKYLMDKSSMLRLVRIARTNIPRNITTEDKYWYTKIGGKIGGALVWKKYGRIGNDEYRKWRWQQWWKKHSKNNLGKFAIRKLIKIPPHSSILAEFVGILLGDGGITKRQIVVSLDSKDDREYISFVTKLIRELFGIEASVCKRKNARVTNIVISRTALVGYLIKHGLMIGNKVRQQVGIPAWIMRTTPYQQSCIRGLIDTDGCIYNECHIIKRKCYSYPRISFVNYSKPLRENVFTALTNYGFTPKIRNNRVVTLEKRLDIVRYFRIIGTNNTKHYRRFKKFIGGVG